MSDISGGKSLPGGKREARESPGARQSPAVCADSSSLSCLAACPRFRKLFFRTISSVAVVPGRFWNAEQSSACPGSGRVPAASPAVLGHVLGSAVTQLPLSLLASHFSLVLYF